MSVFRSVLGGFVLLGASTIASAFTECTVTPISLFAGDGGAFYIVYSNGGSGVVGSTDPNLKQIVALATGALLADKDLGVRYAADGVSCDAGFQTLIGVRLYK